MSREIIIFGPKECESYVGGVAVFGDNLASAFVRMGYLVLRVVPRSISKRAGELWATPRVMYRIFVRPPEIIILQLQFGLLAWVFRVLTGGRTKIIYVAHGFPPASYSLLRRVAIIFAYRHAKKHSDKFISNSEFTAIILKSLFGINSDKIVNPGVASRFLAALGRHQESKGKRTCDLIYVGRLAPEKGVDRIISSLAYLDREVGITIVGEGSELEKLRELASRIANPVRFAGRLESEEVLIELKKHKVFVSGNDHEPFGIAYLEAALAGCIVVCPSTGGQGDIARHFPNVFCMSPFSDALSIAAVIKIGLQQSGARYDSHARKSELVNWSNYDRCALEIVDAVK
jgi:glycosyltransferase involved in cell wall biosynthesis